MTDDKFIVPLLTDHVNAGCQTLTRFADLISTGPTRLFGLADKGRRARRPAPL